MFGNKCRYYPSCSDYALEALQKHKPARAIWLSFKRIIKCQPFSSGGVDPVPTDKLL